MDVTLSPIVMDVKLLQLSKERSPIDIAELPIIISVKLEQL